MDRLLQYTVEYRLEKSLNQPKQEQFIESLVTKILEQHLIELDEKIWGLLFSVMGLHGHDLKITPLNHSDVYGEQPARFAGRPYLCTPD